MSDVNVRDKIDDLSEDMSDANKESPDVYDRTAEERARYLMKRYYSWQPEDRDTYMYGPLSPDCTTMAVAARAGDLSFLEWCVAQGYTSSDYFNKTVDIYAKQAPQDIRVHILALIERVKASW